MFAARVLVAIYATLILSNFAVATPAVHLARQAPEPASACDTPPIRCCQSVLGEDALPAAITELLPPSLNATQIGDVGLNCTTITDTNPLVPETCDGSSVCCGGNVGDAIGFNCVLVTLPTPTLPIPPLSSIIPPLTSIIPPITSILPTLPGLPLSSPPLTSILPPITSILPTLPGLPLTSLLPGLPL